MPFPIVSPAFYGEFLESEKIAPENEDYCGSFISAAALEYVMYLSEPKVVKKLIKIKSPLEFKMAYLSEEFEDRVVPLSLEIIEQNPIAEYYWQIRTLMMIVLQNRTVNFEERMLLLNYVLKKISAMIAKNQSELIAELAEEFSNIRDYSETLEYFKAVYPQVKFSLADGISLLKSLSKVADNDFVCIMDDVYQNLKTAPDELSRVDMENYMNLRSNYKKIYLGKKQHYIENIMVNYVWTYSIPFAGGNKLSIWDNYVFFCSLYNALKVLISCYMPKKSDDDFAHMIASFDKTLRKVGSDIIIKVLAAAKKAGQDNNGDLAVLVIS